MKIFDKKSSVTIFCFLFFVKFIVSVLLYGNLDFVGGGNDADYYHAYAKGDESVAPNFWPVILRFLFHSGLYSRDAVAFIIFILGNIAIPLLFAYILARQFSGVKFRNIFIFSSLLLSCYPTIFYYSLDIYRDVFMYFCFLLAVCCILRHMQSRAGIFSTKYLILFLFLSGFCLLLRGYLGVAMLVAFVASIFVDVRRGFYFFILVYAVALVVCYELGLFDSIIQYRGLDVFVGGGTTFGIVLVDRSPLEFLSLFVYSYITQVFGLYFNSIQGFLVFLFESLIFIVSFFYVIKNRKFIGPFANFLILFFVAYNTIWVMGNDNLGTAVRLRVFSYISVYLVAASMFFRKKYHLGQ